MTNHNFGVNLTCVQHSKDFTHCERVWGRRSSVGMQIPICIFLNFEKCIGFVGLKSHGQVFHTKGCSLRGHVTVTENKRAELRKKTQRPHPWGQQNKQDQPSVMQKALMNEKPRVRGSLWLQSKHALLNAPPQHIASVFPADQNPSSHVPIIPHKSRCSLVYDGTGPIQGKWIDRAGLI